MTREDCGKETKMGSDAALEWIAQQCETTYPHEPVSYTHLTLPTIYSV